MCTRDSCKAGLFGNLRLIRTCVRVIHVRQHCLVTMRTRDSYKGGLFGDFRLIRTYVRMILIMQDVLVTLD